MAREYITAEEKVFLEMLIDRVTLTEVAMCLSEICGEKAEHIRASYSDNVTADIWDRAGTRMAAALKHLSV